MGSKQSTTSGTSTSEETSSSVPYSRDYRATDTAESASEDRARARSLAAILAGANDQAVLRQHRQNVIESIFSPFSVRPSASSHNDSSIGELDAAPFAHSSPGYWLFPQSFIKCPFCSKTIMPDDAEVHLVMCITKPQLTYNEDILTEDKGECVICLEEMLSGNKIARLPCLCIYHKICIDNWFQVNRSCPEHPSDD